MCERGGEEAEEVGYLSESKRMRYRSDKDMAQFTAQVRTFNAVQVCVHPEDPTHTHREKRGATNSLKDSLRN